jgi:hypothetical protein
LQQLADDPVLSQQDPHTQAQALGLPAEGPGSLLRNAQGDLLVYIRLTQISGASLKQLEEAGAVLVHVAAEQRTVTAYVAPAKLRALAEVAAVESVREELRPH